MRAFVVILLAAAVSRFFWPALWLSIGTAVVLLVWAVVRPYAELRSRRFLASLAATIVVGSVLVIVYGLGAGLLAGLLGVSALLGGEEIGSGKAQKNGDAKEEGPSVPTHPAEDDAYAD